jgi:hypothetical protein
MSLLLSASITDLEGCSEGSLCLTALQAQDAVLLKKCKLVCCVLCSLLRKECFVLCLQLLLCPDVAPCFCARVGCLEIPLLMIILLLFLQKTKFSFRCIPVWICTLL